MPPTPAQWLLNQFALSATFPLSTFTPISYLISAFNNTIICKPLNLNRLVEIASNTHKLPAAVGCYNREGHGSILKKYIYFGFFMYRKVRVSKIRFESKMCEWRLVHTTVKVVTWDLSSQKIFNFFLLVLFLL